MKAALIVFAKPAVPGRVKTRLASVVTEEEAAELYHAFLLDALDQYEEVHADVRLYFTEPPAASGAFPDHYLQRGAGLGERMLWAFAETFAAGYEAAVVVGTDHPTLPTAFLEKALDELATPRRVVLGPADDGGYYLLGMNDLRPELFRGMAYSHDGVFEETLRRAGGAAVTVLPPWYDVDTPDDLRRLWHELAEREGEGPATRTRSVLSALVRRNDGRLP